MEILITGCAPLSRRVKKISYGNGEEAIELLTGQRLIFKWSAEAVCTEPGCEHTLGARGCALDVVENWQAANPLLGRTRRNGTGLTVEYVQAERQALPPSEFARERMGWWDEPTEAAECPIRPDVWARAGTADASSLVRVAFGVTVAPDRSRTTIGVAGLRADGRVQVEVVADGRGVDWAPLWLIERVGRWDPVAVVLDGTALPLQPSLADLGVVAQPTTTTERAQASVAFFDALGAGGLCHPDEPLLNTAALTATRRPLTSGWVWEGPSVGALQAVRPLGARHRRGAADPAAPATGPERPGAAVRDSRPRYGALLNFDPTQEVVRAACDDGAGLRQRHRRGVLAPGPRGRARARWPLSVWVYDAMRRQDAQTASVLRAVTLPVRRTAWRIEAAGSRPEVARFVAEDLGLPLVGEQPAPAARTRDRFSWAEHLQLALLMLPFGHSFFEQLYRYDDAGRARLRKLAWRPPRTIAKVNVAADGGLESIEQHARSGTFRAERPIPVSQLVAYVHDREGGNWLGSSLLRPAYKHWLIKDRLLRVQAQTIERNGMGVRRAVRG